MRGFSAERGSLNGGTGGSARRSRRVAASVFSGAGVAVGATGASVVALAGGAVTAKGAIAGAGSAGAGTTCPVAGDVSGVGLGRVLATACGRSALIEYHTYAPAPTTTSTIAPTTAHSTPLRRPGGAAADFAANRFCAACASAFVPVPEAALVLTGAN